jgi:hypothetical protein
MRLERGITATKAMDEHGLTRTNTDIVAAFFDDEHDDERLGTKALWCGLTELLRKNDGS